jgi:hypothetical protein
VILLLFVSVFDEFFITTAKTHELLVSFLFFCISDAVCIPADASTALSLSTVVGIGSRPPPIGLSDVPLPPFI